MTIRSGPLLRDEQPIAVSPTLSRMFGMQAAALLQVLHYWLDQKATSPELHCDHFISERYWICWTQEQLQKAVPLGKSVDPHKRVIKELSRLGVLMVEQHKAKDWDRTNFYSINYKRLDDLIEKHLKDTVSKVGSKPADHEYGLKSVEVMALSASNGVKASDYKEEKKITISLAKNTTTTTTSSVVGSESIIKSLDLTLSAERYRLLIERSTSGLSRTLAQDVADEVCGTIGAIEQGRRKEIFSFGQWIPSLCASAERGELVNQYGPTIANMRVKNKLAESEILKKSIEEEAARAKFALDFKSASEAISAIDEQNLKKLVDEVIAIFPLPTLKKKISDILLSRQLPDGPGCAESIRLINLMQMKSGDSNEFNV